MFLPLLVKVHFMRTKKERSWLAELPLSCRMSRISSWSQGWVKSYTLCPNNSTWENRIMSWICMTVLQWPFCFTTLYFNTIWIMLIIRQPILVPKSNLCINIYRVPQWFSLYFTIMGNRPVNSWTGRLNWTATKAPCATPTLSNNRRVRQRPLIGCYSYRRGYVKFSDHFRQQLLRIFGLLGTYWT